jgi:CheY-like chemotaxis protein
VLQDLSDDIRLCYARAAEAKERADQMGEPEAKADFLNMERHWLLLARSYEFGERLDDFTRENMRQAKWSRAITPVSRRQTPINILIVDDEPKNLTVLEAILDDPGFRLIRAESAEQALLALLADDFALAILDIRMPGMTGFELAEMIKARTKTANLLIVFLTAYYGARCNEADQASRDWLLHSLCDKPTNPHGPLRPLGVLQAKAGTPIGPMAAPRDPIDLGVPSDRWSPRVGEGQIRGRSI